MLVGVLSWGLLGVIYVGLRLRGVHIKIRTLFGPALIFDSEDDDGVPIRLLNVNGTFQSICYTDQDLRWELVCVYHRTMATYIESYVNKLQGSARILVIGGGGMSLPKWLVYHLPSAHIDVLEIDPAILEIARKHFFLAELEQVADGRLSIINEDALVWLENHEQDRHSPYDVIVADAFGGKRPLGTLGQPEGARLLKSYLKENGLVLANIRAPYAQSHADALKTIVDTYDEIFSTAELIPEWKELPEKLQNNVLVARKAKA